MSQIALAFLPMNGVDNMADETLGYNFKPIAFFKTTKLQRLEASSQGVLDPESRGIIDLKKYSQSAEMLAHLDGFSHLWIVFVFHQNFSDPLDLKTRDETVTQTVFDLRTKSKSGTDNQLIPAPWKVKVFPPRANHKVGIFASRSPYRPNPIGISAVKIEKIEDSKITVSSHDLIDQTPILDIKPYLSYADSFPEASSGWLEHTIEYKVLFSAQALMALSFLNDLGVCEFTSTLCQQLRFHPTDKQRKRVSQTDLSLNKYCFSYRTWRADFIISELKVEVIKIYSGYSTNDLNNEEDKYADKEQHRKFVQTGFK